MAVKLRLFKSFCLCFYDAALWSNFTAGSVDKFRSAYVKCIKAFFGYTKFYSVTAMLTELNLQKFDSLIDKCRMVFQCQIHACDNGIVQHCIFAFDVTDFMLYSCVTVLLHTSSFFSFFTSTLLFSVFCCSMGSVPEIKMD